ncbi:MAG: ATP-binding protein [Methanobacteriota archaeon]|nr:MAG: ATP-binding protein [Euryarchaeota archaeon]
MVDDTTAIMEGSVISWNETPNTVEFFFSFSGNLEKHSFVNVGGMLARVDEVFSMNRLLQDPTEASLLSDEHRLFPTEELNIKYAKATLVKARKPPMPGDAVRLATRDEIVELLGIEQGLHIGEIEGHKIDVRLSLTKLFKKHLAILAMSGAGKSYFVSVLLEELLKLHNGPAIVVFDIHGEYKNCFKDVAVIIDAREDVTIGVQDLDLGMLKELFPHITEAQEALVSKAFALFNSSIDKKPEDLIESLKSVAKTNAEKASLPAVERKLDLLINRKVLHTYTKPEFQTLLEPGKLIIVDFSNVVDSVEASFKTYYMIKSMFQLRKEELCPPTIVFVEEAHNLSPERVQRRESAGKELIERVAREGRKFGLSLALITQRPAHLSQTALSQCNSQVFFRITNPNDLQYIKNVSESVSDSLVRSLPSLDTGEAFITGEAVRVPIFTKVRERERECQHSELTLEEMVAKYLEERKKRKEEAADLL